jgi:hypothetical protein
MIHNPALWADSALIRGWQLSPLPNRIALAKAGHGYIRLNMRLHEYRHMGYGRKAIEQECAVTNAIEKLPEPYDQQRAQKANDAMSELATELTE